MRRCTARLPPGVRVRATPPSPTATTRCWCARPLRAARASSAGSRSDARQAANDHLRRVVEAAQRLEVGVVGTFVGRDQHRSVSENLKEFRRVWPPLVGFARERSVKIAIENCPMIFSEDEWPGGRNLA